MKRNMIIFGTILVGLLVILAFVVNYQNSQKAEGNPYGKSNLEQGTIEQLDDPNYQNQILPDELEKQISSGEPTTVYFYSPDCVHCQRTTPVLVPLVQDLGVDMKKMNLLEFENMWQEYGIEATPTLVHYENGEEVARIVGSQKPSTFEEFFQQEVLDGEKQES
ncbi:thioredoxin family protein [Halobacillus hunanensis]|uniref:thioredoxin family protein n=1 Tax=Halobacillus hunanensis TaxID=578214 RepID=UPI0009A6E26F|nr:thioredoxin family protein [Halobacillus hunanensis]